jgi:hypothetical protein
MGVLLAMAKNDGQPTMIPTWGYRQLVSKDKLLLVQIFTDLETGEHLRTTVSQRAALNVPFRQCANLQAAQMWVCYRFKAHGLL